MNATLLLALTLGQPPQAPTPPPPAQAPPVRHQSHLVATGVQAKRPDAPEQAEPRSLCGCTSTKDCTCAPGTCKCQNCLAGVVVVPDSTVFNNYAQAVKLAGQQVPKWPVVVWVDKPYPYTVPGFVSCQATAADGMAAGVWVCVWGQDGKLYGQRMGSPIWPDDIRKVAESLKTKLAPAPAPVPLRGAPAPAVPTFPAAPQYFAPPAYPAFPQYPAFGPLPAFGGFRGGFRGGFSCAGGR